MQTFKTSIFVRSPVRPMMLLGALLAALPGACGGKVVIDQGEGGGGASSSNSPTVSVGPSSNNATVGQGGSSPVPCVGCAVFVTQGEGTLCQESQPFLDQLFFCVCAQQCIPQCTDNVCSGGDISNDCAGCMQKLCQAEFNECANDI